MDNLFIITDSNQLNKIFENGQDKLIVLMFYSKNNPECRRAKQYFEKSAMNNNLSLFCFIDMDKFEGDSRYVNNVNNMPKFDYYYMGNVLATFCSSNEKDIESGVKSAQQYIMMQSGMKNNMTQNNMMNPMMGMNSMPQFNTSQIQQQILNNAMMQNPMLATQLMQNPALLQQMVQKHIQTLQQQYMQQNQMYQQMQPQMQQQMQPQMQQQIQPQMQQQMQPQMGQFGQQQIPNTTNTMNTTTTLPIPIYNTTPQINSNTTNILPTFQQMEYYFKIFQMMQQMGIINSNNLTPNQSVKTDNTNSDGKENIITLPSGDKIIPLADGKYGLIKKN